MEFHPTIFTSPLTTIYNQPSFDVIWTFGSVKFRGFVFYTKSFLTPQPNLATCTSSGITLEDLRFNIDLNNQTWSSWCHTSIWFSTFYSFDHNLLYALWPIVTKNVTQNIFSWITSNVFNTIWGHFKTTFGIIIMMVKVVKKGLFWVIWNENESYPIWVKIIFSYSSSKTDNQKTPNWDFVIAYSWSLGPCDLGDTGRSGSTSCSEFIFNFKVSFFWPQKLQQFPQLENTPQ